MGTGLGHYIPLVAYLGFFIMSIVSLTGRPLLGFYYMLPFLPYRTMRDHFFDYPLGENVLTLLVVAVIAGALIHGKKLPKTKMYLLWLIFGIYLYLSMWLGTALGNAPPPLWTNDINFVTWKDYMLIPLVFVAAGLVVEDRKAVRTTIIITALAVLAIDKSSLLESLSRSWVSFDEDKRSGGPLGYGSNQTAAFLAQFGMFFWGIALFIKKMKQKLLFYGMVAITLFTMMYTFSRASYLAVVFTVFVLGLVKDRKMLILGTVFLFTWTLIVPTAVRQRVQMTQSANGQLDASAEERVRLWESAKTAIVSDPIFGVGYASYQMEAHVGGLRDTHNWYVKVMVETGIIGLLMAFALLYQMLSLSFRLFKKADDPLYKGLGLGLFLAVWACIIANFFGDRWTYLEITGLLWALVGAAARALELSAQEPMVAEVSRIDPIAAVNPYMVYR